jgi:hypothetical protein
LAACPIALWVGNITAAANYSGFLLDLSRKHSLPLWSGYGSILRRAVSIRTSSFDEIAEAKFDLRFLTGLIELGGALADAGRVAEGLAIVEPALEQSESGWMMPELLRIKGELLLSQGAPGAAAAAEDHFRQALDWARRQGALYWELRAATSLARLLWPDQRRSIDATAVLKPVYDRFTEGFDTADLIEAKRLLKELNDASGRN